MNFAYIVLGAGLVILVVAIVCIIRFSKNNMEKQLTRMGNAAIKARDNILKENAEILKEDADLMADINKDAVKEVAHSVKEGLTEDKED